MEEAVSRILENRELTENVRLMTLETHECKFERPGQFAMVGINGKFLRRPISVSSYDSDRYTLVYKIVGEGTKAMSVMQPGDVVDSLTGLGNGYDIDDIPDEALIIGGGIGIPPMLGLVKSLLMVGKKCRVVLGYKSVNEMFMLDDFNTLCGDVHVMTEDGSFGEKGYVTDAFSNCEYACACGPLPMLKALSDEVRHGQFSLEARMGCGFGACMGCSIKTSDGFARVCKEGPVFDKEVIEWKNI